MSKRFGRNQRRRLREKLAQAAIDLRTLYDELIGTAKERNDLRVAVAEMKYEMSKAREVLGWRHASLPPILSHVGTPPQLRVQFTEFQGPRAYRPFGMENAPLPVSAKIHDFLPFLLELQRDGSDRLHLLVKFKGDIWAYAISEGCLAPTREPKERLAYAGRVAEELAKEITAYIFNSTMDQKR